MAGVGGLNQPVKVTYLNNSNPGIGTAKAIYSGDANHQVSSDTKTFAITYGLCSPAVGAGGVILQPINSDGTSMFARKGGSTLPVKFRVCDASGNPISDPAAVFAGTGGSLTMLSAVRGTVDVVNEPGVMEIPDTAFRFSGNQWVFNMATSNLAQGTTVHVQNQPGLRQHSVQGRNQVAKSHASVPCHRRPTLIRGWPSRSTRSAMVRGNGPFFNDPPGEPGQCSPRLLPVPQLRPARDDVIDARRERRVGGEVQAQQSHLPRRAHAPEWLRLFPGLPGRRRIRRRVDGLLPQAA